MMKTADRVMNKFGLPLIFIAGALMIVVILLSSQDTNKENNAYIRVINCIVTKNASTRTQSDIEDCYKTVEAESGVSLKRYDGGN